MRSLALLRYEQLTARIDRRWRMPLDPPRLRWRIGWGFSIALLTALVSLFEATLVFAQQALPSPPPNSESPHGYGPEVWFVIAGVLITVGINLEQLRRCRADIQDLRKEEKKQNDNLTSMDHRLQRIEDILAFLKTRRRADRDYLRSQGLDIDPREDS